MTVTVRATKTVLCDCGQILLIYRPEDAAAMPKLSAEITIIPLVGASANCPKCGKLYFLPPAETFDIERHPALMSVQRMMDDIEREHGGGDDATD